MPTPAVRLAGEDHIDAGVLSATHCDLAEAADRVVILRPTGNLQGALPHERPALDRALILDPDAGSRAAFGDNPMDPAGRQAAAEAGRRQGVAQADSVRSYWDLTP